VGWGGGWNGAKHHTLPSTFTAAIRNFPLFLLDILDIHFYVVDLWTKFALRRGIFGGG
jgi:hypothetical protein